KVSGQIAQISYKALGKPHTPKAVALCFDDGPWPSQTLKVLQILRHFKAKATFFMIGEQVPRWPQIAMRVNADGMAIGDHSWDHPNNIAFDSLTPNRINDEILQAKTALQNIGVEPTLFRPPGGSWDPLVVSDAAQAGMRVV